MLTAWAAVKVRGASWYRTMTTLDLEAIDTELNVWRSECQGDDVILADVVRCMLLYAPTLPSDHYGSLRGQASIIRDIQGCQGDRQKLRLLGQFYHDTLLAPSK